MNVLDDIVTILNRIEKRIEALEKKEQEKYIDAKEVASIFGCKIGEIYAKVRKESIPYHRIGGLIKFKRSEII